MSNNITLFIVEGEKDCQIINSLCKHYGIDDSQTRSIIYRSNIYQLFNVFQKELDKINDDFADLTFLDTYSILKEIATDENKSKLVYDSTDIVEIYLFFDLDAHTNQAKKNENKECISEMLALFNDAFDKGKLYISYPMVEAYKHPFGVDSLFPINNKILINNKPTKYKDFVDSLCKDSNKELNNVNNITKELWDAVLLNHLIDCNDLIYNKLAIVKNYNPDNFSQPIIYQKQLEKYIIPHQQVRVISPFVLFLLDYFGDQLLNEWMYYLNAEKDA